MVKEKTFVCKYCGVACYGRLCRSCFVSKKGSLSQYYSSRRYHERNR